MTTQEQFVLKYYPEALKTEAKTGISATAVDTTLAATIFTIALTPGDVCANAVGYKGF
jgi:hypothetical protein